MGGSQRTELLPEEHGQGALHPRSESGTLHATAFVCVSVKWTFCKYPPPGEEQSAGKRRLLPHPGQPSAHLVRPMQASLQAQGPGMVTPSEGPSLSGDSHQPLQLPCRADVQQEGHMGMVAGRAVAMYGRAMVVAR